MRKRLRDHEYVCPNDCGGIAVTTLNLNAKVGEAEITLWCRNCGKVGGDPDASRGLVAPSPQEGAPR